MAGAEADGAGAQTHMPIDSTYITGSYSGFVGVHQVHPVTGMGPAGPTWTGLNPLPATVIGDVAAVNIIASTAARMPKTAGSAPNQAGSTNKTEWRSEPAEKGRAFAALCGRIASSQHPYDPDHGGDPPVRPLLACVH